MRGKKRTFSKMSRMVSYVWVVSFEWFLFSSLCFSLSLLFFFFQIIWWFLGEGKGVTLPHCWQENSWYSHFGKWLGQPRRVENAIPSDLVLSSHRHNQYLNTVFIIPTFIFCTIKNICISTNNYSVVAYKFNFILFLQFDFWLNVMFWAFFFKL